MKRTAIRALGLAGLLAFFPATASAQSGQVSQKSFEQELADAKPAVEEWKKQRNEAVARLRSEIRKRMSGAQDGEAETAGSATEGNSSVFAKFATSLYHVPSGIDDFELYEAPTYRLGDGTTIRVTGSLRPSASTVCVAFCPLSEEQAPAKKPLIAKSPW